MFACQVENSIKLMTSLISQYEHPWFRVTTFKIIKSPMSVCPNSDTGEFKTLFEPTGTSGQCLSLFSEARGHVLEVLLFPLKFPTHWAEKTCKTTAQHNWPSRVLDRRIWYLQTWWIKAKIGSWFSLEGLIIFTCDFQSCWSFYMIVINWINL